MTRLRGFVVSVSVCRDRDNIPTGDIASDNIDRAGELLAFLNFRMEEKI
jgi:hypothetical protein